MNKRTLLVAAGYLVFLSTVARAEGAENAAPPSQPAVVPSAGIKPLCDQDWRYGFSTVVVEHVKYDGKSPVKDYDPDKPEEPWSALSDQYLGLRDQAGGHFYYRFIGQFYDEKKAEAFLTKVYQEARFARHLSPRYRPHVLSLGALLVSDHYTCTLNINGSTLFSADWIAEVDGNLYAARAESCKNGKRKKTISVVDCTGTTTLFTDTLSAPCEETSSIIAWIFPMSPGFVGIKQEYSAAGDELVSSFRVYDVAKKKAVVNMKGGGALSGDGGSFREFKDQDGDDIPEVFDRECEDQSSCVIKHLQKWNGTRFVNAKAK